MRQHPDRRALNRARLELAKAAYHLALGRRESVEGAGRTGSAAPFAGEAAAVKTAVRRGVLRAGRLVETTALVAPWLNLYRPRAYYPEYLLGQMRAERTPADGVGPWPDILPVSRFPELPGGGQLLFAHPPGKRAFDRYGFPDSLRDSLTRDYEQLPLLLPPGRTLAAGIYDLRARLLRIGPNALSEASGLPLDTCQIYEVRGLNLVLALEEEGCSAELVAPAPSPLPGALWLEMRLDAAAEAIAVQRAAEAALTTAVAEVSGDAAAGACSETRVFTRLWARVCGPVICCHRQPNLLSLFMPADLGAYAEAERFFEAVTASWERAFAAESARAGIEATLSCDFSHDARLPFMRQRQVLRSKLANTAVLHHPQLEEARTWLAGDG
ncbi:MAG: hypothetical protein ACYC55_01520 [Candidatus Geothermincolia bacterium]